MSEKWEPLATRLERAEAQNMSEYERGRIAGYEEAAKDTATIVNRLNRHEATLRNVQSALKSDSIEYDDMRNINVMIEDALAGFVANPEANAK
jgi:hypothetical protein